MNKVKYLISSVAVSLPFIAFAQTQTKDLNGLIGLIAGYLNSILALLMGIAVVAFVWYVIKYFILKPDADRKEANMYIMWSLIGFFIILSFWGVVNILISTFNFAGTGAHSWADFANIFPK